MVKMAKTAPAPDEISLMTAVKSGRLGELLARVATVRTGREQNRA